MFVTKRPETVSHKEERNEKRREEKRREEKRREEKRREEKRREEKRREEKRREEKRREEKRREEKRREEKRREEEEKRREERERREDGREEKRREELLRGVFGRRHSPFTESRHEFRQPCLAWTTQPKSRDYSLTEIVEIDFRLFLATGALCSSACLLAPAHSFSARVDVHGCCSGLLVAQVFSEGSHEPERPPHLRGLDAITYALPRASSHVRRDVGPTRAWRLPAREPHEVAFFF